jgi:phosphatidylethanolamine/phosphatidyl-N-methylethanolamine N-methyltransferase
VFGKIMASGRRELATVTDRTVGRILIIGIGTGLELQYFGKTGHVIGIDLSEAMLRHAKKRIKTRHIQNVDALLVMDAMRLGFPDACFDAVAAPYVITVVPNPNLTLTEILRVTKPGGDIVLVNHVSGETGIVARIEGWLGRHSAWLGWRPEFAWSIISEWINAEQRAELIERRQIAPFGLFTLTRIRKR